MMTLDKKIESILFVIGKPLSLKKIQSILKIKDNELDSALDILDNRLKKDSGLSLLRTSTELELVSDAENAEVVQKFIKTTEQGELSRASLEALTILAYRGPMTRPELEQIRGVQSSMIIRNLLIRGLIEEKPEQRLGQVVYEVTLDFLRHLGVSKVSDLPDYERLHGHESVNDILRELKTDDMMDDKETVLNAEDKIDI